MNINLTHEKLILEGTYGDREVHLCRCVPKSPNGIQVIVLHGVHSSANAGLHNKFRCIAELLVDKGFTVWLVETSRRLRNRHDFADNVSGWIKNSFEGKTFAQEQEDVFIAVREIIRISPEHKLWIWGFSLGGIIAISAAAEITRQNGGREPAIDKIILSGTGFAAYEDVDAVMMRLPILCTLHSDISPDIIDKVRTSGIISFRGSKDEIFSEDSARDILKKINIPEQDKHFKAIEGADHSMRLRYGKPDAGVMEEMVDFIIKTWN